MRVRDFAVPSAQARLLNQGDATWTLMNRPFVGVL